MGQHEETIAQNIDTDNAKIVVPYNQVIGLEETSFKKVISGLQIEAAFQLEGDSDKQFLNLKFTNTSGHDLSNLMLKFQSNSYSLNPITPDLPIMELPNGCSEVETKVELDMNGQSNNLSPECPIKLKAALNTQLDIFVFEIPCSFTIFLRKFEKTLNEESYKHFLDSDKAIKTNNQMECEETNSIISEIDSLISKLEQNNIVLVFRQSRPEGEMLNTITSTVDGLPIAIQIYMQKNSDKILMKYVCIDEALVPLVFQAIKFIISL